MRKGRTCLYPKCNHCQGNNVAKCKFRSFPQDLFKARRWLFLCGIMNLTPKKLLTHWTICSCHFTKSDHEPDQYIEEYGDSDDMTQPEVVPPLQSPAPKKLRLSTLTPSSKDAVDALLLLPEARMKQPTYSPKRSLWRLRESISIKGCKSRLHHMASFTDFHDELGVLPLPNEDFLAISPPLHSDTDKEISSNFKVPLSRKVSRARSLNFNGFDNTPLDNSEASRSKDSGYMTDYGPLHGSQMFSSTPLQKDVGNMTDSGSLHSSQMYSSTPIQKDSNKRNSNPTILFGGCDTCGMCGADLNKETRSIGIQCIRSYLCYENCKLLPEEEFRFYTGITQQVFEFLYEFLGGDEVCARLKYDYMKKTPKRSQFQGDLYPKDKLFMTLLRIRRGFTLNDLKVMFKISESHASKICYTWIRLMSLEFRKLEKSMFVSRENQDGRRPKCFKDFKNLRVIIDGTEFRIQKPTNQQQSSNSFSDHKNYHTIKFLVGISCYGGLSFISEGFEGSISDRKLIEDSGFMDHLEPHDGVMSDKGFDMEDKCDEREVDLYIPSFLGRRDAFTGRELLYSRAIAVSRIFVEIFIGKIKEFRLVRYLIPNSMLPVASDLVRVCAFLVNFQSAFIKIDEYDTSEL